jgi:hypothetical protein
MFGLDGLRHEIEGLDPAVCADSVVEIWTLVDMLTARATSLTESFERTDQWAAEGASSYTAWLRHKCRRSGGEAHKIVTYGRRMEKLPVLAKAWLDGRMSGGQINAVMANVSDKTLPLFQEHEAGFVPRLEPLSVKDTVYAMRTWRLRAEALLGENEPADGEGELRLSRTLDDRWVLNGDLSAEQGQLLADAIRIASPDEPDPDDGLFHSARDRARGLEIVVRYFLDNHDMPVSDRNEPHVSVVVHLNLDDDSMTGGFEDGAPLSQAELHQYLCDAGVSRVIMNGISEILDQGRNSKVVSKAQRRALRRRDGGCRWHGCGMKAAFCHPHHIWHWVNGGPTDLSNLVLLCPFHHRLVHTRGLEVKLLPDGTFEMTCPDGQVRSTSPPGADVRQMAMAG